MKLRNNYVQCQNLLCMSSVCTPSYYRRTGAMHAAKHLTLNEVYWKRYRAKNEAF